MGLGAERYRTTNVYNGFDKVSTTPPTGGTPTSTLTDSLGRTTSLSQYLSATPTGTAETTTYGYDPRGNMTSMTDPAGNAWSWAFNVMGQQVTAVDPDAGTTTSTYDLAGNLLTSTDNRGVVLAYSYDNLNRKTGQYLTSTGSSGSILASWTYDTIAKGQLTSQTTYVGSTAGVPGAAYTKSVLGYDSLYHPTSTKVSIPSGAPGFGGTSYTTSYTYYQDGSLLTQVDPAEGGLAAETIKSTYGGFDNLTILRGAVAYAGVDYSGILQPDGYNRTGATTEVDSAYGYDQATGAVLDINDQAFTNGVFTTPASRVYTRNNAGSITSATNTSTTTTDTQCYSYDHLNNLTAAWTPTSNSCAAAPTATTIGGPAPYWDSYTVDPATGNRLTAVQNPITAGGVANTDTYSYPAAHAAKPHAVTTVTHVQGASTTTSSYGYDADGDTTSRPGQTLTYDKQGKLSTVTAGATTQTNIYDPAGGLLLQTDPTNGTTLYLGDTELHVAPGTTTASAVRTYSAGGVPVAERTTVAGVTGSTLFWLTTDIDGTVDTEINASTAAVTHRYSDPYGNIRGTGVTWSSAHSFLNAPTSSVSGLVQLGARAYDPSLGRFLSVDAVLAPLNPVQNNGYAYAGNSPIDRSDPSGNCFSADDHSCVAGIMALHGYGPAGYNTDPETNPCLSAGCKVTTSPSLKSINKKINKEADAFGKTQGWSPCGGILAQCTTGAEDQWLRDVLKSSFGHLVGGWADGYDDKTMYYGSGSELVEGIRSSSFYKTQLQKFAGSIALGGNSIDASRSLDGPMTTSGSKQLMKDLLSAATAPNSSQSDQVEAALGTYALYGGVVSRDAQSRTAVVYFRGSNAMTLGSAISATNSLRQLGYQLAPSSGALSNVQMEFGWTENVPY
jgi:RHS repeat-associated protein